MVASVAVRKHGQHEHRVPVVDLPLPTPAPEELAWIEAYPLFASCGG